MQRSRLYYECVGRKEMFYFIDQVEVVIYWQIYKDNILKSLLLLTYFRSYVAL